MRLHRGHSIFFLHRAILVSLDTSIAHKMKSLSPASGKNDEAFLKFIRAGCRKSL